MMTKGHQSSLVNLPFPPLIKSGTCAPSTTTYPPRYAYRCGSQQGQRLPRQHRMDLAILSSPSSAMWKLTVFEPAISLLSVFITAKYNIADSSFTSNSWLITGECAWSAAMARVDGNNAPPCMYMGYWGNAVEWLKIDLLHKYVVYGYYNTRCTFWWNLCISLMA